MSMEQITTDTTINTPTSDADLNAAMMSLLSGEVEVEQEESTEEAVSDEGAEQEEQEYDDGEEHEDSDEDDSEDAEKEEEADESSFEDDEFTILIDGEETVVKGSELKSGYMRHKDYTKKTQELSSERKALNDEKMKVVEQANVVSFQATNRLNQLEKAVSEAGGWAAIRNNYPPEQVEQFTQMYVTAQKDANAAEEVVNQYTNSIKESNVAEVKAILNNMSKVHAGFTANTFNELDSYLTENGFTKDMAMSMTHPQAWDMVYKAMLYDKAQSRTKQAESKSKQEKQNSMVSKKNTNTVAPISGNKSVRRVDKATQRLREANKSGDRSTMEAAGRNAIAALLKG